MLLKWTPQAGRSSARYVPASHAYAHTLGPFQPRAMATTNDAAAAASTPIGSRAPCSTSRVRGTAVTSSSARNTGPTPASAPKWWVHFDRVSHSAANASAVADPASHSGVGSG